MVPIAPLATSDTSAQCIDVESAPGDRSRVGTVGQGQASALPASCPRSSSREAIAAEWIRSDLYRIPPSSIQPASLDLRLGEFAWALRCSFLPDAESKVEEKIADIAFQQIDLRDGAALERDRPYLVPLIEELALPRGDPRARRIRRARPAGSTCSPG